MAPCALAVISGAVPIALAMPFAAWWIAAFGRYADVAASVTRSGLPTALAVEAMPSAIVGASWLAAVAAATVAAAVCGSIGWTPGALRLRFSRLAPATGIRQLASGDAFARTGISLAAILVIAAAAAPTIDDVVLHAGPSWQATSALAWHDVAALWARCAAALSVVAAIDVVLARRRFAARLRMTPREVRDERAEQEGRPEVKSRRRGLALRRSRRLRIDALKRASAVVTNPTHVAVALRYEPPAIDVPVVVGLGAGPGATIVRAIASFHDVPIIESPDLARALFARTEVDDPIPEEMYAAIAAIFAWILRTRGRLGGAADV